MLTRLRRLLLRAPPLLAPVETAPQMLVTTPAYRAEVRARAIARTRELADILEGLGQTERARRRIQSMRKFNDERETIRSSRFVQTKEKN